VLSVAIETGYRAASGRTIHIQPGGS